MKLLESLKTALRSLRANKLRSGLTMLGIIIGVGFVILLVSLGSGARTEITSGIQGMGSNLILVVPFQVELDIGANPMQQSAPQFAVNKFTAKTAEDIERALDNPEAVDLIIRRSMLMSAENNRYFTLIDGTGSNYFEIRELETEQGRYFTSAEVDTARQVIVIGKTIARALFGDKDPLGEFINIRGRKFKVIGIQEEKGRTLMFDMDSFTYIPYTTASRLFGTSQPDTIVVKAKSPQSVDREVDIINETLSKKLTDEDFTVITQSDALEFAQDITEILTYLLGAIAGISLLVGGIGIMNIMLVSVTERTREVGIRKAVGAKTRDILVQFLVEAVTMSVIGGVIGIGIAVLGSALYEWIFNLQTQITAWIILLAFLFSMMVGVFFGVYPATKAARLDPIESLRYE